MNILLMMLRSARPSRTEDMKAVAKPRWIKQGYEALTFFGTIITHTTQEAEMFQQTFRLPEKPRDDTPLSGASYPRLVDLFLSIVWLVLVMRVALL